jgi:hypothetical protein
MDRRQFTGVSVSAAAGLLGLSLGGRTAQSQAPSLKDTLEKELKARRPSDIKFIALVVKMVNNKTLPKSIVLSVFHYVRKKRQFKKNLVPYFAAALRLEARKKGIKIP